MKDEFITEYVDGEYYVMLPLNTKNRDKAVSKADEILNDILSCIGVTEKSKLHANSPNFLRAIRKISKNIWRILK